MTTTSGRKMHIISYYTKREAREGLLRRVVDDARFDSADGRGWNVKLDEDEYPDPALALADADLQDDAAEAGASESPISPAVSRSPATKVDGSKVQATGLPAMPSDGDNNTSPKKATQKLNYKPQQPAYNEHSAPSYFPTFGNQGFSLRATGTSPGPGWHQTQQSTADSSDRPPSQDAKPLREVRGSVSFDALSGAKAGPAVPGFTSASVTVMSAAMDLPAPQWAIPYKSGTVSAVSNTQHREKENQAQAYHTERISRANLTRASAPSLQQEKSYADVTHATNGRSASVIAHKRSRVFVDSAENSSEEETNGLDGANAFTSSLDMPPSSRPRLKRLNSSSFSTDTRMNSFQSTTSSFATTISTGERSSIASAFPQEAHSNGTKLGLSLPALSHQQQELPTSSGPDTPFDGPGGAFKMGGVPMRGVRSEQESAVGALLSLSSSGTGGSSSDSSSSERPNAGSRNGSFSNLASSTSAKVSPPAPTGAASSEDTAALAKLGVRL